MLFSKVSHMTYSFNTSESALIYMDKINPFLTRTKHNKAQIINIISMAWCKTAVTPLLTHWSYCSLALSHRYVECTAYQSSTCIHPIYSVDLVPDDTSWSYTLYLHRNPIKPVQWLTQTCRRNTNLAAIIETISCWHADSLSSLHGAVDRVLLSVYIIIFLFVTHRYSVDCLLFWFESSLWSMLLFDVIP